MPPHAATKRLTREYANISKNPPPYITAHPSEGNILEWHYILTGPPDTPYHNGQYWGTLIFPNDYPFAPPAIRMHTPSGRFQTSTRLCLSISDFHPKSFNPAWEVSTILLGLQSFMNSDEITTGSINNSEAERRAFASRTRWWNSTGGGSTKKEIPGVSGSNVKGVGNVKAGDGGQKFRKEWAELDEENWKWMKENRIEPKTGVVVPDPNAPATSSCAPGADALRRRAGSANTNAAGQAVVEGAQQVADAGGSWVARHKALTAFIALMAYVVVARLVSI